STRAGYRNRPRGDLRIDDYWQNFDGDNPNCGQARLHHHTASACGVCTQTSQFKVVGTEPAITHGELSVRAGQTLSVTATFRPTGSPRLRNDVLRLVTSHGEVDFTLSGVGQAS